MQQKLFLLLVTLANSLFKQMLRKKIVSYVYSGHQHGRPVTWLRTKIFKSRVVFRDSRLP